MLAIYRKELHALFFSFSAYAICIAYLVSLSLFLFFFEEGFNLLDYGYADLTFYFEISPWIFTFILPALSMGSFSQEYQQGTFELLQSRPIGDMAIFLGKYLAVLTVAFFCILPTFFFYYTIYSLGAPPGNLDIGSTLTSYLGVGLVCCVFSSIGVFGSSLSGNQITAFMLSVFLCFFLFFGFEGLSSYNLLGNWDYTLQQFGISYHYKKLQKGLIDSRSLIYFVSLIAVFWYGTLLKIKSLKW